MAGFLIFVDGEHLDGAAALREIGCDAVLASVDSHQSVNLVIGHGGPSGMLGTIICPHVFGDERDPNCFYRPDSQTWRKVSLQGKEFWIGTQNDSPEMPNDVARRTQYSGPAIRLRDGNEWIIPACFLTREVYGLDDQGQFCRRLEPQSPELIELIGPTYEALLGYYESLACGDAIEWKTDDHIGTVGALLCRNYHITAAIAIALGLLSPELIVKSIMHATDFERFVSLQSLVSQQQGA